LNRKKYHFNGKQSSSRERATRIRAPKLPMREVLYKM
jgi:hypothetical protein